MAQYMMTAASSGFGGMNAGYMQQGMQSS